MNKKHNKNRKNSDYLINIPEDQRGAYLMKILGLNGIKKEHKERPKKEFKIDTRYEEASKKKWNFSKEDFIIKLDGENGYIVNNKNWDSEVWITNSDRYISSYEEAEEFIDNYIKDSLKPLSERNFKIHLVA